MWHRKWAYELRKKGGKYRKIRGTPIGSWHAAQVLLFPYWPFLGWWSQCWPQQWWHRRIPDAQGSLWGQQDLSQDQLAVNGKRIEREAGAVTCGKSPVQGKLVFALNPLSQPYGWAPIFYLFSTFFPKLIRLLFVSHDLGAYAHYVGTKSCSMIYQSWLRLLNILRTLLGHSTHCSLYCASLLIVYTSMYIPIVLLSINEAAQGSLDTQKTFALSSPPKGTKLVGFIAAVIVLRVWFPSHYPIPAT